MGIRAGENLRSLILRTAAKIARTFDSAAAERNTLNMFLLSVHALIHRSNDTERFILRDVQGHKTVVIFESDHGSRFAAIDPAV